MALRGAKGNHPNLQKQVREAHSAKTAQPSQLTRGGGKGLRASRCPASGLRIATAISLDSVLRNQVLSLSVASCVATAKARGLGGGRAGYPGPCPRRRRPKPQRGEKAVPGGFGIAHPCDKPISSHTRHPFFVAYSPPSKQASREADAKRGSRGSPFYNHPTR